VYVESRLISHAKRMYGRICSNCSSQEYDVKGLVAGNPFKPATILAGIQNYRTASERTGESILLWFLFFGGWGVVFSSGFSIFENLAGAKKC